ncbi:MAG: carboxypeptidase regulatory-like domain-containing protein [Lentimicrobium sp.]|jgi:hypothetical protein|nr:carboxypeptidase regulatory-like domain-containing protein [Lentimicrobium sp.]
MKNITLRLTLLSLLIYGLVLSGFAQKSIVGTVTQQIREGSARNGQALYDQLGPLGVHYMNSQLFTNTGDANLTCIAADDFIVPEGETWGVRYIDVLGAYFMYSGTSIDILNISIYENDNNLPGDELFSFLNYSNFSERLIDEEYNIYKYEIMLPETIDIASGHYWISVQVVSDNNVTGQWGWFNQSGPTIENEFVWKNPLDGSGLGYTDWTPASMQIWMDFNLSFALYGEGEDNDLSLLGVDSPDSGGGLGTAEIVTITLKNEGVATETGFEVSYTLNDGTPVVENVGALSLSPNQTATYSFATPADLSIAGLYTIAASVNMAGDPNPENNEAVTTVYNYGMINAMPATGTQTISSCGATFTDAGGLEGNIGMNDDAITTFIPENVGDRVRLTFLEFDASWGGFSIYNGSSTEAPLIGTYYGTESPGEIIALNAEGALTVHFMGPGWEETSGWIAFISCVTPLNDDFSVINLSSSMSTLFQNSATDLSVKIQNYGTQAQDKTVTFKANNEVIGTLQTGTLASADTVLLVQAWTPTVPGTYVIEVSVPDDDDNSNNSKIIEKTVYAFDAFFEDFEGSTFPPENWINQHWGPGYGGYSGNGSASVMVQIGFADTLISPRLSIADNGSVSFYAVSTMWWPGNLTLLWQEEGSTEWVFLMNPALEAMQYKKYVVDMSVFAGQKGRIGFMADVVNPDVSSGQVSLDYVIGQNVSTYYDDFDLKTKAFDGERLFFPGETSDLSLMIRNNGLETVPAGNYNVKLYSGIDNPVELVSMPGLEIASGMELSYDFSYAFAEIGAYEVYAEIEFSEDEYLDNNSSESLVISIVPDESNVVIVGEDIYYYSGPVEMSFNNSLIESLYLNDEINQQGVIFGLTYNYMFNTPAPSTPVRIWVGMTDAENLEMEWVTATDLQFVYEGTLNFRKGEQTIYIPFQTPFDYNDASKHLVVMVEKIDTDVSYNQLFESYNTTCASTRTLVGFTNPVDPYTVSGEAGMSYMNPVTGFVFNDNLGSANGSVTFVDGSPIEGASVVIDELSIVASTNAEGNYIFPFVPAGIYSATASAQTYQNVTQSLQVVDGAYTVLNFEMASLPQLSIFGSIVGNDNNGMAVENATVTLSGYESYTAQSNAMGEFLFEDVFGLNSYTLMIEADGYLRYTMEVAVESEDIDLGEIVLTEALDIPYVVFAELMAENMEVNWNHPSTTANHIQIFDDGVHEDGYAGEPVEEVWMGNIMHFDVPATITGFDMYWAQYNVLAIPQSLRLDIFDSDYNLIVSSDWFESGSDEWVYVSVPNITLQGDYYAMVYWNSTSVQSTYFGWDAITEGEELAYYKYSGGDAAPLSNIIGVAGNMMLRPHVMMNTAQSSFTRALLGYDISVGKLEDISNVAAWEPLNSSMFNESNFTDNQWPPSQYSNYVYAVKAYYSTGESEFSFSNVIDYLGVNTISVDPEKSMIYPNPASDRVTVTGCANAEILIFTMDGRTVSHIQTVDNNVSVDVSHLSSGSYLLVIKNTKGLKQHKLLVQ